MSDDQRQPAPSYLPAGTPVDVDNCEREPIHIPGSTQPHGVLLTVGEASARVRQVSANCSDLLGLAPEQVLELSLPDLFDAPSAAVLTAAMSGERLHAASTPLRVVAQCDPGRVLDALVHRSGEVWIVELEPRRDQLDLVETLGQVRAVVSELAATSSTGGMQRTAVERIRMLTGFDRVMLYRFDREWNGEVVAEARRDDLEPFLGLHYPAGDIPPQARALYTVNWLRFIGDVGAVNAPLVPVEDPVTGQPLDQSLAALRSVSPVHVQYLRNMGVTASMSVSLVIDGELAGLIACHHYSGPYVPSAQVRAACEFLAQTTSLMLGERERNDQHTRAGDFQRILASVLAGTRDAGTDLGSALERHAADLLRMFGATGMAWTLDGRTHVAGEVPGADGVLQLRAWARAQEGVDGLVHTDSVALAAPELAGYAGTVSGLLMLQVADDQDVMFFRPEAVHTVDWGGNPHLKVLRVDADGAPRLTPRGSFALWRETVRLRSATWEEAELEAAAQLRTHLVQLLYERNRALAGVAETLQRSLLPETLPSLPGWSLAASYRPASVGVGGDWYDAVPLPGGAVLLVVGDVAGHGLVAAGAMAQMRNALRAYAVEDDDPVTVLARLDRLVATLTPDAMATAVVVRLDPAEGELRIAAAGHPAPVLCHADGTAALVPVDAGPPLGAGLLGPVTKRVAARQVLEGGATLLLVSDGMFERRDETVDVSLAALVGRFSEVVRHQPDPGLALEQLFPPSGPGSNDDDATLLLVTRHG